MKKITYLLLLLLLLISCKSNIKNIKLIPIENDKKWNFYINSKEEADYKKPLDTIFVYKPISFRLVNNTGYDIKINYVIDNFLLGSKATIIVNSKSYEYDTYRINFKKTIDITMFTHLPIPIADIDKEYLDRLPITGNKIKHDSIVLGKISPRMQDAIDSSFKKKFIIIKLLNRNNTKEEISVFYCAYKQKVLVFDSDSLSKANPRYRPDCN